MKIKTTPLKNPNDKRITANHRNYDDTPDNGMACVYNSESPTGKTILITNYSPNPANTNNAANQQKSSITIYTHKPDTEHVNMPPSSINILINNHYENSLSDGTNMENQLSPIKRASIKLERIDSVSSIADTTLTEKVIETAVEETPTTNIEYHVGEDVLARHDNENFYWGVIESIRNDSFAIKYDDNQVRWLKVNDLKRIDTTKSQPICIICKNVDDTADSVRICCQCQRGFHDKCLPKSNTSCTEESRWCCFKCIAITNERLAMTDKRRTSHLKRKKNDKFSYDIDALTWDIHHRQNIEQIYCYCGKIGKWFMQMLQCVRCQQWFHASCVKCLNAPLYFGDRFYLFACAHCNDGVEFLRRLHMNMEDIVHLLLFNLTLHFSKRYYNLTNVIFPYARDNWPALQLPPKLKNMQANDVKDEILRALRSQTARFKAGKEAKKKVSNWALVSRSPPKAPNIVLPQGPMLTEKFINDLFCEQARINYMPQHMSNCDISVSDAKMKDIMFGKNVAGYISSAADCEGSTSSDESENVFASSSDEDILADVIVKEQFRCVTNSDSTEQPENETDKSENLQQASAEPKKKRGRPRLSQPEKSNDSSMDINYSSDDTSSRGTLDSIIPPPANFTGINNPFLFDTNVTTTRTRNSIKGIDISLPSTSSAKNQVQMVRTVKRRLSANDIIIGPNMKVKRRKLKKRLDDVEVISTTALADLPTSATFLPISSDSRRISLSALRSTLRDQPKGDTTSKAKANDRKKANENDSLGSTESEASNANMTETNAFGSSLIIGSISTSSPIKESLKEGSINDLKSSVNMYFGGMTNRIENGDKFAIKGKRVLADGRQQYLIEWDGVS